MSKIETLILNVNNTKKQRQFYHNILGMKISDNGDVGYNKKETNIRFSAVESQYQHNQDDTYWKIALSVPNIELAREQLIKKGVVVGEARQFQDIGYLAHFQDPEGFIIELIEHHFKGDRPELRLDTNLLGGGAHLNLLTMRTSDIQDIEDSVLALGMKPLSIQPVESHGFTLYFYAFTDENPPCDDLYAIQNRTWVYQRPYSVLEVQYVHHSQINPFDTSKAGYAGTIMTGCEEFTESLPFNIMTFK